MSKTDIIAGGLFLVFLFFVICRADKDTIVEINQLQEQIQEYEEKLDRINELASNRNYNYNDLLDDIELESRY